MAKMKPEAQLHKAHWQFPNPPVPKKKKKAEDDRINPVTGRPYWDHKATRAKVPGGGGGGTW